MIELNIFEPEVIHRNNFKISDFLCVEDFTRDKIQVKFQ